VTMVDIDLVCVSRCLLTGLDFRQVLHQATTAERGMRSLCRQTAQVRQVSACFIYSEMISFQHSNSC